MKIYFAPLEGITSYVFRNAYSCIYGNIDKFFTPFITPSEKAPMSQRERNDVAPENNNGTNLVPQILACRSDCFIEAAKELHEMGYNEVNLNLGCPSGTVCAKGKGAGFLADANALQTFLDAIYNYAAAEDMRISVKTRLGYNEPDEFYALLDIFNCFPLSELIVHPRIRSDYYKGETRKEYFSYALERSRCPLVYNGDIFSVKDRDELTGRFRAVLDPVMLGRGLISDPSLADKLNGLTTQTDYAKFRKLHDTVYEEYRKVLSPDINVLYKMRELWSYWQNLFDGCERDFKHLQKAKKCAEYEEAVNRILQSREA